MKTKLLCTLYFLCPLALSAANVHKLTPITTDKDVRVEISLSAEANEHLSLDAVISNTRNGEVLCNRSKEFSFKNKVDTTIVWKIDGLNPELWSPVTPVLYNLEIKTDTEVVRKRIGFRKFEMRNGVRTIEPFPGVVRHVHLHGAHPSAPPAGHAFALVAGDTDQGKIAHGL